MNRAQFLKVQGDSSGLMTGPPAKKRDERGTVSSYLSSFITRLTGPPAHLRVGEHPVCPRFSPVFPGFLTRHDEGSSVPPDAWCHRSQNRDLGHPDGSNIEM